jgi:gliding motility-associated-like protein
MLVKVTGSWSTTSPIIIPAFPSPGTAPHSTLTASKTRSVVENANGCQLTQNVGVAEPNELVVDLGQDTIIDLGDNVSVIPESNVVIIDSFIWLGVACINCPQLDYVPLETASVSLSITDLNGCSADDGLNIGVRTVPDVYVPSAFSPNGDGVNDLIFPFVGRGVADVLNFRIYNRWGEIVFDLASISGDAIRRNDPNFGWDGTLNGQPMQAAVFVWYTEVKLINGKRELLRGDFVLMR